MIQKTKILLLANIVTVSGLNALVINTEDFETTTAGGGQLTAAGHSTFVFGSSISGSSTSTADTDPIQGIVSTSAIGTGQAGYLGGGSTNYQFDPGFGVFSLVTFEGNPNAASTNIIGTNQSQRTITIDFAVSRSSNSQDFSFFLFDGLDEFGSSTFQYHSYVDIASDNSIFIRNNDQDIQIDTGFDVIADTAYTLLIEADYDAATWSASITNQSTTTVFTLADDNAINDTDFTLSGWTTLDSIDIQMQVIDDLTNGQNLDDLLVFDNFVSSVVPELSNFGLILGSASLCLVTIRRRFRKS